MQLWHAVVYGIVEGLTEFLPVSSTGHLILTARLLGHAHSDFLASFEIAIQLGAILAVVFLYWKRLLRTPAVLARVAAAFVPTAVLGLVFYKVVKRYLLASDAVVLWALFLGGVAILVFERFHREAPGGERDLERITYRQALLVGLFQAIAMVPGVSRSGATVLGGLALGLPRRAIVEFSFLLAVPTMLAATALDLLKSGHAFTRDEFAFLAVGAAVSFAVAMAAVRFFLRFVQTRTFAAFGWYRIALALAFWFVL